MTAQTVEPGTRERTENSDPNRDRLVHLICKPQIPELDAGHPVWTMCGHFIKTVKRGIGKHEGLRCIICEELRKTNTCIHCQRQTNGGN